MADSRPRISGWPEYTLEQIRWEPTTGSGPRVARRPVTIEAYVPGTISRRRWQFSAAVSQAAADAQAAAERAEAHAHHVGLGTLAQQLLRSEALASSQIEGVQIPGHRAVARASIGGAVRAPARATLANLQAIQAAVDWARGSHPFSISTFSEIHQRLAAADRWLASHAGTIRTSQNWIGRNAHTPAGAEFVPPPHHEVPRLLEDLAAFLELPNLPPVLQAAIAHAQFETIHPFADGNGRVGRTLIGATLVRARVSNRVVPPVSLVLAGDRPAYVQALTSWRFDDPDELLLLLAGAIEHSALATIELSDQIAKLGEGWRSRMPKLRSGSGYDLLIDRLPSEPIIDVARAAALIERSPESARRALAQLEEAGIVRQISAGRRNRVWEAVGLFALVDEMERTLSRGRVGGGHTRG